MTNGKWKSKYDRRTENVIESNGGLLIEINYAYSDDDDNLSTVAVFLKDPGEWDVLNDLKERLKKETKNE